LIPGLGKHRLDKLRPEHLERFYNKMLSEPYAKTGRKRKPATVHQVHRTARTAFGHALRRGHLTANPAALASPPRVPDEEVEPYSVEEVQRLRVVASERRNSARWAVALALGFRQGESLGLKWAEVDLEKGTMRVRRSRLRPKYEHGCGGDCGRKHPGYCPERKKIRPDTDDTKSRAGRRTVGLPPELVKLLEAHRTQQDHEREIAGQLWKEGDWVFATPTGEAINPRTDYDEWKRILAKAKLRDGRLHDARHTAATVLLILRVSTPAAMGIMGWSNAEMAKRYQHLTSEFRTDIAKQVGGLFWAPTERKGRQDDECGEGAAGARVPA
jgi:integrase